MEAKEDKVAAAARVARVAERVRLKEGADVMVRVVGVQVEVVVTRVGVDQEDTVEVVREAWEVTMVMGVAREARAAQAARVVLAAGMGREICSQQCQ